MNRRQKEVQQTFLNSEKAVLKALEKNYQDALNEIDNKIAELQAREDADLQHVIYQIDYQRALKSQVQTVLDQLHNRNFDTLSEYLTSSYEDGFIGTMYDLQGQGIPLVFPIDQAQVAAAIQHETKLSESLYSRLGKDTSVLSRQIAGEISRGITNASMYSDISRNISDYCGISKNKAMRIARTESHRIQCKATADAQHRAKEKGADVVKQWDSSLDGKTRETHRELDGQIRELDDPFEVQGMKAMQPGGFGIPSEDCNCRCALLQRARWALGNDYTKWSPDAPIIIDDDGTTQFVEVKALNYNDFKEKYKKSCNDLQKSQKGNNDVEKSLSKKGIQVNVDEAGKFEEQAHEALKHLDKLTDEYKNTVVSYSVGKIPGFQAEMGSAYMMNGKTSVLVSPRAYMANKATDALKLGEKQPLQTTYHEFAHSLSQSREKTDPQFWKEIRKIKREYEGIRGKSNWFDIKISDYASKDVDEFLAEAFTQAKLSDNPSLYSKQVLDVVDKYFKKQSTDGLAEMPDIKFATKKNSAITAKQKFQDTMTVSQAYNELPIKVKQNTSDVAFEFGYDGSACDIWNKTIRVGIGTSKEEVFHEMGHLVENYMMSQADVRKYKEFLVDGLSCNDIMVKTYYDNAGNDIEIYLLKGMNFESEYQSRLYVSNPFDALNGDGTINVDTLGEAISEVFRKYMNGETLSREAQELIEKVIL